ncbi:hypothetical protein [Comamonas thiooxydans]|uniref:hypothetical protein n=1 Tax=Comamonas thiooxydans TaxID=363952 RepID=UPI000B41271B|nr:hypothetical protein [Comamonas thiooxydans]
MNSAQLDPRIGMLNSGKFYAYVQGNGKPETVGTLEEVERALGVFKEQTPAPAPANRLKTFDVVMRFASPAWDEVDGLCYPGIVAEGKAQANQLARKQAERDGHAIGGRGRYTFTATEI